MVQIEKRRLIWYLHSLSSDVLPQFKSRDGQIGRAPVAHLLHCLTTLGVDVTSPILSEIVSLTKDDDREHVDVSLLFHVLAEAVGKILDRNALFWNTVMSVSSTSVAWIDFRRKLSKWLSTNGMGLVHIKNVLSYVQQNVDKNSSGIVRKEAFLKFTEEIMGIDCLLSPDALMPEATPMVRPSNLRKPIPMREAQSVRQEAPVVERHDSLSPISLPETITPPVKAARAAVTGALSVIRIRLAFDSLSKLFNSRTRIFFALNRIIGQTERTKSQPPAKQPYAVSRPTRETEAKFLASLVTHVSQRIVWAAFSNLRCSGSKEERGPAREEEQEGHASGPSWAVTIQAVAIANLFGIFRTSLVRCVMPSFFALKAGCRVDSSFPPRRVLWAQSKQGKKDSQAAMGIAPRGVLQPIQENVSPLEFDLSS